MSSNPNRHRWSGIVTGMRPPEEHAERLDRLVQRARTELRDWTDAPEHEPGVALLELFAFLGDALSSYTDAVASESHLGSRRRGADIGIAIDGQGWQRVASLDESGPDDPHYVVTVGEDGSTVVEFGDGIHGRRPPSGGGMRVSYRAGRHFGSVVLQEGRVTLDSDWKRSSRPGSVRDPSRDRGERSRSACEGSSAGPGPGPLRHRDTMGAAVSAGWWWAR
jgi:hypothetical protein